MDISLFFPVQGVTERKQAREQNPSRHMEKEKKKKEKEKKEKEEKEKEKKKKKTRKKC
jgi:hypothetical protein